ncbi:hypothetical protein A3A09_00560 [Candidatus Nomurabacteria bacterium RIFCSPLOWO2_01_FULL_42_20]|uniref:Major facilitator superfamily (MFS) profile domain-containing protein n=1 Tax=Candidatus Nomurabacteria bacterium RIFCSPHIGHO2_01_FULL_42_16 TaxID=1801743 RepID=A0A1F6VIZ0_9BACT|nr:MAG: hypothetical protein A2824_02780 [Candidatus Nomurabacteria bacterium RIFCSPHIGHO2_01_FULL_42_16]OGI91914.1 MAG: hypothetical protein A3A09_00560 [Candidatus Nomurabacteria bacterium RIFCSPLOWO2_01_FULL_42_20]
MNRIIKILIYSDVLILSAFSLYLPIFAIFIATTIKGGSVAVAGLAAASYWTVRAIVQLPISRFIDKHDGEKRSFQALILGSFLFSIVPFLFVFAELPWHIYVLQAIYALGDALAVPTYFSVFSHHIVKVKANFQWGLRSVSIGIGIALASAFGGYLAEIRGFDTVFIITGIVSVIGSALLIALKNHMLRPSVAKGEGGLHGKEHGGEVEEISPLKK